MNVEINPKPLTGTIAAPPSKSYAHRYLIAAYLAGQECRLRGVGHSKDVEATLGVLSALGMRYTRSGEDVAVQGVRLPQSATVYCGESGSTLRFMLPVAAALGVRASFGGESGLLVRPISQLVEALNAHGADVRSLTINGRLQPGEYVIDGRVSSQYVTGLLFALPLLSADSRIVIEGDLVSKGYIDVTLDVLSASGICVRETSDGYYVKGKQTYRLPPVIDVEGDWSGAAFFLAAGALGSAVTIGNLNEASRQGDRRIADVLQSFGADVTVDGRGITVRHRPLRGTTVDLADIPDLAQIISVVAAFAEGTTTLCHVDRLRVKESDRLQAIMDMLKRADIACRYREDALYIEGGYPQGAPFTGGGDHRTAMSACIMAAYAKGASTVSDAQVVDKSYPAFFTDFKTLGGEVHGDF